MDDPRRALGRRPQQSHPPASLAPRIVVEGQDRHPSFDNDGRYGGISDCGYSQGYGDQWNRPPAHQPYSAWDSNERSVPAPVVDNRIDASKGAVESRQLLKHLLDRLEARPELKDVLDMAVVNRPPGGRTRWSATRATIDGIRAKVSGDKEELDEESPSNEDKSSESVPDQTIDLVEQIRGLLFLAQRQGVELFASTNDQQDSPVQLKRQTGLPKMRDNKRRQTRSPRKSMISDPEARGNLKEISLLDRTLQAFRAVILLDASHQVKAFRPLRPPNALQVACLDIASCLCYNADIAIRARLVHHVIQAASVMPTSMTRRLYDWLSGPLEGIFTSYSTEKSSIKGAIQDQRDFGDDTTPFTSQYGSQNRIDRERVGVFNLIEALALDLVGRLTGGMANAKSDPALAHAQARVFSIILDSQVGDLDDLLSVVAYGPEQDRSRAVRILCALYPDVVGVNLIAEVPVSPDLAQTVIRNRRESWGNEGDAKSLALLYRLVTTLLADLNLSHVEIGLRLVTDRVRLAESSQETAQHFALPLLQWVMNGESNLHLVVKRYISKRKLPPGIRAEDSRGASSVSAYRETCHRLLDRYVKPWMRNLYLGRKDLYSDLVYSAAGSMSHSNRAISAEMIAASMLERIAAVYEAGLHFGVLVDLLLAWFEDTEDIAIDDLHIAVTKPLGRLFKMIMSRSEGHALDGLWDELSTSCLENPSNTARVCRWSRILSGAGTEIPWTIINSLLDQQSVILVPVDAQTDLVITMRLNSTPIPTQQYADLCYWRMETVVERCRKGATAEIVALDNLLHQTFLLVLQAYDCDAQALGDTALMDNASRFKQAVASANRRRQANDARVSCIPQGLPNAVLILLRCRSISQLYVVDFLSLLLQTRMRGARLDSALYDALPAFFGALWETVSRSPARKKSQHRLLLLILHLRPEVIQSVGVDGGKAFEAREILLDLVMGTIDNSSSDAGGRSSLATVSLLLFFLESALSPQHATPAIRVMKESLQPTHLTAMSHIFENHLARVDSHEKVTFLAKMGQIQLSFSGWQVISSGGAHLLLRDENRQLQRLIAFAKDAPGTGDVRAACTSLAVVGLTALPRDDGLRWNSVKSFAEEVGTVCSAPWPSPAPAILPLLSAIRTVLDSDRRIPSDSGAFENGGKNALLLGFFFVKIGLSLVKRLPAQLDSAVQKALLDIATVIIVKHPLADISGGFDDCVLALADFAGSTEAAEGNADNRLSALQALHLSVSHVDHQILARTLSTILLQISPLLQGQENARDRTILREEARSLLDALLKTASALRIPSLLSNQVSPSSKEKGASLALAVYEIPKSERKAGQAGGKDIANTILRQLDEALRQDATLVSVAAQAAIPPLKQLAGEVGDEFVTDLGAFISRLGKHVAESKSSDFNPSYVLQICTVVIQNASSRTATNMLHQTSTFLHLCLMRFDVDKPTLSTLLNESESLSRRGNTEDTINIVVFELIGSVTQGMPVAPASLLAILTCFQEKLRLQRNASPNEGSVHWRQVLNSSGPGLLRILLRNHPTLMLSPFEPDVMVSIFVQAAAVLVRGDAVAPGLMDRNIEIILDERASRQLDVLQYILLATCEAPSNAACLVTILPIVTRALSICLRECADWMRAQDIEGHGAQILGTVFTTSQILCLACKRDGHLEASSDLNRCLLAVWRQILPDWEQLLDACDDPSSVNLPLKNVVQSVFLDTVIYLQSIQSPVLDLCGHLVTSGMDKLRRIESDSAGPPEKKLLKAEQALRAGGDGYHGDRAEDILAGVRIDLVAIERIRMLQKHT